MSDAPPADEWLPLAPRERRVLGVLIEKQKTSKSADAYPMTLNSITTGCNQKSNRDPVMELDEDEVEEVLAALQKKLLVMKMTGSRVDRWRHLLYEAWRPTKVEMAVLAELLLRGGQTEGDLRARASRMDEIADLDELRTHLQALAARKLVIYLTEPGKRGSAVTHGFGQPGELEREKARFAAGFIEGADVPAARSAAPAGPGVEARLRELEEAVSALRAEVAQLRGMLGR